MTTQQFEPMSSGQILDKVFRLYKENFVRFIATVAIIQVPLALITMIWLATVVAQIRTGEPSTAGLIVGPLALTFLSIVGQSLCNGALIKSISESYLGNEVTVSESYRFILPKLGTLIWASILVGLVVMVGFVLLIVPGIIFLLVYYLTIPAIVLENLKARQGMGRSKLLVKGNLGKVFVIGLVVILIGIIVGQVFEYLGGFLVQAAAVTDLKTSILIGQMSSLIGQVLVMPIGAAAVILLYYDMRIRKEGFDLEMLAKSLGTEGAVSDEQPPVQ